MSEKNIVLLGGFQCGISSTGNTILQNKLFKRDQKSSFEVKKGELDDGTPIKVYKPGFNFSIFQAHASPSIFERLDRLMEQARKVDIICFVFKYDDNSAKEEVAEVKALKSKLGNTLIKNNGIIVVTNGDKCRSDAKIRGMCTDAMLRYWRRSVGSDFQELISDVGGKILLVDNDGDFSDKSSRLKSSRKLRKMIRDVVSCNSPYTKREYDREKSR